MRARTLFIACAVALLPALAAVAAPTTTEKDNYERILAILITGNAENKKTAKASLKGMGENGLDMLKGDIEANPDGVRGALAWSLLKEFLLQTDVETLRDIARKNLVDLARAWNNTYKGKADAGQKARLRDLVADYVSLLSASDKPKDFDLLLKALQYSIIAGELKADYAAEFKVWDGIWKLLSEKAQASESAKELTAWQATVDGHFRRYSLLKDYATKKTIQAYHGTSLVLMQRIEAAKKKPAATEPAPEKPAAPDSETPIDLTKPKPAEPAPEAPKEPEEKAE